MMNDSESSNSTFSTTSSSATSKSTNDLKSKNQGRARTVRDEFFTSITKNEKNWSAICTICNETILDSIGVTSNVNRHVKKNHLVEYNQWCQEMKESEQQQQPKLLDFMSKKRKVPSPSKQSYPPGHQRQQQLHDAIVQNLIVELGLPLSLVERPEFIKFMSTVDPKFTNTSRQTLTRKTIPCLYSKMNDELKKFCATAEYISLTIDIWTDRRTRSFFSITGKYSCSTSFPMFAYIL